MSSLQRVIVTGATGAIGKAIAKNIAKNHNYEVIIIARNEEKGKKVVQDLKSLTNNNNIHLEICDLSLHSEVKSLAERIKPPIHVLINCAAATPRKRMETKDGIEYQFATNVLGYFWMMYYFVEHLKKGVPSRVINVASYWAGNLNLSDLEFKKRSYDNDTAYRQSKQANRMLTVAFAERWKQFGISVNSCHPGDVNSTLSNDLGFGGHETPDQGAETPVWLATTPMGQKVTGKYFEHKRETMCQFSSRKKEIEDLYQICLQYTK